MLVALTVLVTSANGRVQRLGPDERDGGWVPENITFGTSLPGGWKEGSFNLRRRADEDVPLRLLDEVEIIDESGSSVYEGRIQQLPRQTGDDFQLGVNCLGWAAHLLDDTSFSMVFRDEDLGQWGETSVQRKIGVGAVPHKLQAVPSVSPDSATGSPALVSTVVGPWGAGVNPLAEAMYDAGAGNRIGQIDVAWKTLGSNINAADANWFWALAVGDNDVAATFDATANLRATGATGAATLASTGPRRYGFAIHNYNTGAGADNAFSLGWTHLAVAGDHGLTKYGVEPDAGYYIDDMVAYALGRSAPKINFSTGFGGSIERPPLVVRQAVYRDPTSVDSVLLDLNKLVLWDWMVYENRTFFYRPTDPDRLTWEARLDQGIHLSLEGDDAEHAYNGCMVKFTTPAGTSRVAGPVGSGFDVESDLLGDLSVENTVNAHGYPRKWIELDVQFPLAADVYATTIGSAYLAQASLPARSGSIELTGLIRHPTKGLRPVHEVRSGDWIRLSDHPADVPRRIVATSYDHDSLRNTVTVGNDVDKISALLEQLGVLTTLRTG